MGVLIRVWGTLHMQVNLFPLELPFNSLYVNVVHKKTASVGMTTVDEHEVCNTFWIITKNVSFMEEAEKEHLYGLYFNLLPLVFHMHIRCLN
jgi:hypothetical protein